MANSAFRLRLPALLRRNASSELDAGGAGLDGAGFACGVARSKGSDDGTMVWVLFTGPAMIALLSLSCV
jgi:hypothetical protein